MGCKKPAKENATPNTPTGSTLTVRTNLGFKGEGGAQTVDVKSSSPWKAEVKQGKEWLTAMPKGNDQLVVTAKPNVEKNTRSGIINLSNDAGKAVSIRVKQMGSEMAIEIPQSFARIKLPFEGNEKMEVEVSSNTTYTIVIPEEVASWVEQTDAPALRADMVTKKHYLKVHPNTTGRRREATIKVQATQNPNLFASFVIDQAQEQSDVSQVTVIPDKKLVVTGATASSFQAGSPIANTYDGKYGTGDREIYHSPWNAANKFPITLEYFFNGNTLPLQSIRYHSRNGNGNFGKVEVWVKTANTEYTKVQDTDLYEKDGDSDIPIPEEHKGIVPTAVKFVVKSGKAGFASCSEMEFFTPNDEDPQAKALTVVFTDKSCSELKEGVSDDQIAALPDFFRQIALKLKNGTYPAEEKRFRIQECKPYSTPEVWSQKLITRSYSHLNNPLGIIVEPNEEIVVLVDNIQANGAKLACAYNLTHNTENHRLVNGVNKITFTKGGNLFLLNEWPDPRNQKSVRVHIPPQANAQGEEVARVGYNVFDLNVDKTDDVYRQYLAKSRKLKNGNCTFVLKGRKIVFTVRHAVLQNQERHKGYGVVKGLQRWDDVMDWEQELAAIKPFADSGEFNTLMHVSTCNNAERDGSGGGLYATDYRINMDGGNDEGRDGWGFKNNFDPRDMDRAQDNQWGVGHELGHMHQGAINWGSTTESSNNLFSNYVVYKIGVWGSRGSSLEQLATYRFAPPTPWVRFKHLKPDGSLKAPELANMGGDVSNKHGLYQGEDSETHMRLNQQLWTYFDRCGFQPGFINKLFVQARENTSFRLPWGNPGESQMRYARSVAQAAQMDMTEFFDAWGFFQVVDRFTFFQYGAFNYGVTQEMIDETLKFMKQFKTKCPPIQYIEDRMYDANSRGNAKGRSPKGCDVGYFETFKNKVQVTKKVTYTVSGRTYSVSNGDQAVAFELRRPAQGQEELGKLVWFANRYNFTVPNEAKDIDGAELYAVQYDGKRIKATKSN